MRLRLGGCRLLGLFGILRGSGQRGKKGRRGCFLVHVFDIWTDGYMVYA